MTRDVLIFKNPLFIAYLVFEDWVLNNILWFLINLC